MTTSGLGTWDLLIIVTYLLSVMGLGCYAGLVRRRRGSEGSSYFLAGNSLRWPVIGLAMFAANISAVHLVSLAEAGYKYGLVFGNFEWMAGLTLVLLSLFFAPLYVRSRVPTLPDLLERRFNGSCRQVLAVVSLFSAIVIHIGVALYTAAWVLRGILGLSPGAKVLGLDSLTFFIVAMGVLTGIYTVTGGLLAVVWTESVQTVLLLVGATVIGVAAFVKVGGWGELSQILHGYQHPLAGIAADIPHSTSNFLSMARDSSDLSGLPWYSVLLGYPILGIWYWCADQTVVQRVLAARDERQARLGPLFCAVIKVLPVFLFVLPGTICVALVQKNAFGGAAPALTADTYSFLITQLLPAGLKGLVMAATLAAAMQTCSAALNSTATIVAYDLVKRNRPGIPDDRLVAIGKLTTIIAAILAILWSPFFAHYTTIFDGLARLISYISPPITAVFLFGIFWRKASGKGALITLISGSVMGGLLFVLDFFGSGISRWSSRTGHPVLQGLFDTVCRYTVKDFMLTAFYLFLVCAAVLIMASKRYPEPLKEEARLLVWENWREPLVKPAGAGWLDYRLAAALVILTFALLYALMA